jgi:hypothetical protein
MRIRPGLLILSALALALPASAGTLHFALTPSSGVVSGQAGTNVGWGFTFGVAGGQAAIEYFLFSSGQPDADMLNFGTDFGLNAIYVPPDPVTASTPLTQYYDASRTGGLEYLLPHGAVLGSATEGWISIVYDWLGAGKDPDNDTVYALHESVYARADVTSEETPEPSAGILAALGGAGLFWFARRKARA